MSYMQIDTHVFFTRQQDINDNTPDWPGWKGLFLANLNRICCTLLHY